MNYYNDISPYCGTWLVNLMKKGLIPDGKIDLRPIQEVTSQDLRGYRQCHFFAGIGGWPLAMRWSGYEDVEGVWTGSCPCQPFSAAGLRKGEEDARHVWPAFHRLIAECRPTIAFGEQVGGDLGYQWLTGIRLDLEGCGYAFGAANLPACAVGAPHERKRLYWCAADTLGDATGSLADRLPEVRQDKRAQGHTKRPPAVPSWALAERRFLDGKRRRIKPGLHPLADGVSRSVAQNSAYGNAIVPQLGQAFIEATFEAIATE